MEQLLKLFNDSDSFYFSPNGDLTNSMQRKLKKSGDLSESSKKKRFEHLDDRFFWNKFMLTDLLDLCEAGEEADHFIQPVIQGYFQFEVCPHHESFLPRISNNNNQSLRPEDANNNNNNNSSSNQSFEPVMILISRRSRHMAGTRYKRRGVDADGQVANYVETEQMFRLDKHVVSFVQVRGSIPVFWSQVGHSYRPPPKLDRSESETQVAFEKHFQQQLDIYSKQVIVNLIEGNGREAVLGHAYLNHVLNFDSPDLTYVSFDFHEYCRGMRFENVSVLMESLEDVIRDMRFCWSDDQGLICDQTSVFRVNCVDCLDRTNVVQTAFARVLMDQQLTRLGLLPPDSCLPASWRRVFNSMWANNGDVLSRQYAGTAALKSDFTRTGERKLTGMVKDGVNSATRYYQNRFKDQIRQAVIDLMMGVTAEPEDVDGEEMEQEVPVDEVAQQERMRHVMDDVKKLLIPEHEVILGSWPLADADSPLNDMDCILILTQESFFVADYDEETDRVTACRSVLLEDMTKMELGLEPMSLSHKLRMKGQEVRRSYVLRLFYLVEGMAGFFYALKSTNCRFFNNMTIAVKSADDEVESLKAILESFKVALSVKSLNVPVYEGRLERKKSKVIADASHVLTSSRPAVVMTGITNVGSRAISGVSSQFAKFRGRFRTGSAATIAFTDIASKQTVLTQEAGVHAARPGSESEEDPSNYSTSLFVKGSDEEDSDFSNLEDEEEIFDREHTPTARQTVTRTPSKSLSETDISDENLVKRMTKSAETTMDSGGRQVVVDQDDEQYNSLPPTLTVTQSEETTEPVTRSQRKSSTGSGKQVMLQPQMMQATVSMVNILTSGSTGDASGQQADPQIAGSCMALAPRNCSPEVPDHQSYDDGHIVPIPDSGLFQARSSLTVCSAEAPASGMKNSHSAAEMLSLVLSPLPSPASARKELLMSPFNRIAKGVHSLGLNISSLSPSSSPKKKTAVTCSSTDSRHLNQLSDAYDREKRRKRASKTRIIEL